MSNTSLNISLPKQLKEKIKTRISTGDFSTPSDYVRHLVREDIAKQDEEHQLAKLIQAGIDSGISDKSADQIFSELRKRIKSKSM